MAKQPTNKSGTGRVRLIVLDAEIPEGDFGQIAQALQNALRLPAIHAPRALPTAPRPVTEQNIEGSHVEEDDTEEGDSVEDTVIVASRNSKPRKLGTPDLIEVEPEAVADMRELASARKPKADTDKALFAMVWFKDRVGDEGAGTSHVYTCYKYLGWSLGRNKDFGAPLQHLKRTDHLRSVSQGKYAPTAFGLLEFEKMGNSES